MKRVSNAYKQAMAKMIRDHSYMVVSLGVVTNEAQHSAQVESDVFYLSDNRTLFNDAVIANEYATCEENVFKADGSQLFAPEGEVIQLANNIACISEDILGSITVGFDNAYDIKGLTITFGEYYPTSFKVAVNGTVVHTYSNGSETFVTEDVFNGARTITITPVHFVDGDNKRLRIERMVMGVGLVFKNRDIESASLQDECSFISEELPRIDFSITCFDRDNKFNVDDDNAFIHYLEQGQAINTTMGLELEDGTIEWVNMPVTYLDTWSSSNHRVTFSATDRLVFMGEIYEDGNYIHERTLGDDALAIFQFLGLAPDEYFIDDVLFNVIVTNPLPRASCAECLQLIANAGRCALKQDVDGKICLIPNFENIVEPNDITVESDTQADWSKPSNIRTGTTIIYADMTQDFFSADGSMYFLPENGESYLDTGYVSKQISDDNGNFFDNLLEYPYQNGSVVKNGITFTDNGDGTIHVQGTATAATWYGFRNNGGDPRPMMADDVPWKLGDILEADYFLEGTCDGNIGITWGYKTPTSSNSQGYIFYRARKLQFTDSNMIFSCVQIQDVDPLEKSGMYVTGYLYVGSDAIVDMTVKPVITLRKTLGNLLVNPPYRLWADIAGTHNRTVNNSKEINGVTYTVLEDGGILVNGTATAESYFEYITPYNNNNNLEFELGHTYKLTEGREVSGRHTNPYIQWVRYNTETQKYDYTLNTADGDKTYTHTNENLSRYGVRIIVSNGQTADNVVLYPSLIDVDSYDENELNPTNYVYGKKPSLSMELPAAYTYYGINMKFGGNPPKDFKIKTYDSDELLDTFEVTDNDANELHINHEFYQFDKLEFEFDKGGPNDRVLVNEIAFAELTDYRIRTQDMIPSKPLGHVEPKVKDVRVKIFTFENDENDNPKQVDDNEYFVRNLNAIGEVVTFENQLVSTAEHAERLAKWLGNYYSNNVTYSVSYRGEPRIESLDYLFMDSDVVNNLQVEVESCTLNFNGSISGQLNLRRAINMLEA